MGILAIAGAALPGCFYGDRPPEPSVGGFARTSGGVLVAFSCDGPVEELHLVPKGTSPDGWEAFHPGELWVTMTEPDRGRPCSTWRTHRPATRCWVGCAKARD